MLGALSLFGEDRAVFGLEGFLVFVDLRIAFKILSILLPFLGVPSEACFGFGSGGKLASGTSS